MPAFVVIGVLGLTLIVVSLLFGDFLDGLLPDVSLEGAGGLLSTQVIGSFLAAFGFAAALLVRGGSAPLPAAAGGAVAGATMAAVALAVTRSLMRMGTDPTPRTTDLVGAMATVVTPIPREGLGEITVLSGGQRSKLSARADAPITSGTRVVVVAVTSPTSVVVTEAGF